MPPEKLYFMVVQYSWDLNDVLLFLHLQLIAKHFHRYYIEPPHTNMGSILYIDAGPNPLDKDILPHVCEG